MPAAAAPPLDGDEYEFDSLFDDQQLLDPELEESLAQAEATYTASQAVQQPTQYAAAPQSSISGSSFRLHAEPSHSARRIGTFVQPPAKKQRIDPGPSNLGRVAAPRYREPEPDQVIVRDLRDDDFADNDDEQWWAGNNALDQVEEEAIRMSQQMPSTSQQHTPTTHHKPITARSVQDRSRHPAFSTKPADSKQVSSTSAVRHDSADGEVLAELKAEVERLRAAHKAQQETVDKLKQEAYRKSGEVAVVRQNLTKLNLENSKLREREVARELEHRTALERLQKDQERRLHRLETETAFRRVEQDTSRRIWPSSVARLPPVGLRDVDRRQDSQVRAGLTTPTKANRFGVRGGSASGGSGSRHRYADTAADREEPSTPTRSTNKVGPHFPRPPTATTSASKTKAFRGLQNSFADFGPVQEKIRQQRQSPTKTTKANTLPPADWEMDQSRATNAEEVPTEQDNMHLEDDRHADPTRTTLSGSRGTASDHSDRTKEHHYLAAVSEILSRRTTIVSLLLSHSSITAAAPTSYPSNRFNPSASHPSGLTSKTAQDTVSSSSTLGRLISANLVSDCPPLVLFRYREAVESLLTSLSRARVLEPEEREDALALLSTDSNEQSIEELDFSSATMHLSHAIASSLLVMAGVLLRLCQTDLLTDVLRLATCLVSTLPRFWLDLECLEQSPEAKGKELAFLGVDESTYNAQWSRYATPIHVREILAQCIDGCRFGTNSSRHRTTSDLNGDGELCQGQVAAAVDARRTDGAGLGDWSLSPAAREDLLHAVVQVLEAMSQCPDANPSSTYHPLRLLSRPGVLHKLLHPDRSSLIIFNVVRMLTSAVSNAPLIHECLASKADGQPSGRGTSHSTAPRANARFPVLELLVKHLVDRRFDMEESEWHVLHRGILTFLTQAALRSADTLIVLADSAALLAALIRCLSLDSDFVWLESRPTFLLPLRMPTFRSGTSKIPEADPSGGDLLQAAERIVMDTRLLNLLYNYPLPNSANHNRRFEPASPAVQERMGSISLAVKLDQPETYSMLNGIRQSFIVALTRIAFCSEPDWIASERKLLASLLPDVRKRAELAREKVQRGYNDDGDTEVWAVTDEETVAEQVEQSVAELDRVSTLLEAIADVAGDLADIVLSPEEIDSVYELLVEEEDEDEDAMDVDQEELHKQDINLSTSSPEKASVDEDVGSETESEPELDMEQARASSTKVMHRTASRSSKSASPTKRNGDLEEADMDVIEIDDSD
ncbi:hypothetical protein EX895_003299 [Sporisorium graminicola]|uniref:Uncharacterized protein n=1 Tax=Sporisorium graminicola TaxID=280036 RepID=A0A4U7KW92_9BASI|nr:hypothetical protein EX895_003299 [Sporisorium graminicola]TKY87718.1 hypothetical protein EX895_003299 [Sporisorium graminicola]